MGLDFSIFGTIRNKHTNETLWSGELAYWRKCWNLRTEVCNIAQDTMYWISSYKDKNDFDYTDDYYYRCDIKILDEIIKMFCDFLPNKDAEIWTDSLWGSSRTRQITMREMCGLIAFQSFADYQDMEDAETLFGEDVNTICNAVLECPENYEFEIEIYNSY